MQVLQLLQSWKLLAIRIYIVSELRTAITVVLPLSGNWGSQIRLVSSVTAMDIIEVFIPGSSGCWLIRMAR
jgi:hypothetical protein